MTAESATSGSVHKVKSTATSVSGHEIGYPHGHLGHLSGEEENAFSRFKAFLEEKGAYKPGPPPSHDDPTLLRFLRARRWIVEDAYQQFKDTEDWRAANHLDLLYDSIDLDAYEQSRRLYPQWTGRRDRRGIPLYLFEIRHLDSKTIAAYEKAADNTFSKAHADGNTPPKLLRLFALYENLTRFIQPMCTELPDRDHAHTPITLSTNIVDVSGVSLRQFWNLKAHMQAASQLATAHYPETLDRIFIIGAPMFFSTVWGWIKRWFDPITVSKIFILGSHEVKSTLESFVDPKNIPKQYGGGLDFKWGDMPNLDPLIQATASWENGFTAFPKGPVLWKEIDGGARLECVAVGTDNQKDRYVRVCTLPRAFPEDHVKSSAQAAEAPASTDAPETAQDAALTQPSATTGVDKEVVPAVSTSAPPEAALDDMQNLSVSEPVQDEVSEKVAPVAPEPKSDAVA